MGNNAVDEELRGNVAEEPSMEYVAAHASDGLVVEVVDGHPAYHYPDEPRAISQTELEACLSVEECRARLTDIINNHYES